MPIPSTERLPWGAAPARRLWVIGTSGSGKTTLGRRLARIVGVPPTDMDELHWLPGWRTVPEEDLHERVAAIAAAPAWVISGNYDRYRARQADRVELVVWIDLPFAVVFGRLVRRTADRAGRGTPCCNGNRETWRKALLTRDSILLWGLKTFARRRRRARLELAHRPHVRLRSARQIEAWLHTFANAHAHQLHQYRVRPKSIDSVAPNRQYRV